MAYYFEKWKRVRLYNFEEQEEYAGTLLHNGSEFIKRIGKLKVSVSISF
jgi:hypothetical protein